jgi:hypothetical protein
MESKMEIYDNKVLLINTRRPELILQSIPKSKVVKEYDNGIVQLAVHWGVNESIALSDLKIKNAPSPISKDYC